MDAATAVRRHRQTILDIARKHGLAGLRLRVRDLIISEAVPV